MTAKISDGEVLYAIGDIHGRTDLLSALLVLIEEDAAQFAGSNKALVFLGDYVDRGPDSRGVIDMLINGLPSGFESHYLKGNHEQMLLDFLADASCFGPWCRNGGDWTLRSYGVAMDELERTGASPEAFREAFVQALPPAHRTFFEALKVSWIKGDYVFVHAGMRPGIALDDQEPADMMWIRDLFLESDEDFGKVVVHGHTPERQPVARPNRIGIDTGAVFSGSLTALRLSEGTQAFLQTAP